MYFYYIQGQSIISFLKTDLIEFLIVNLCQITQYPRFNFLRCVAGQKTDPCPPPTLCISEPFLLQSQKRDVKGEKTKKSQSSIKNQGRRNKTYRGNLRATQNNHAKVFRVFNKFMDNPWYSLLLLFSTNILRLFLCVKSSGEKLHIQS